MKRTKFNDDMSYLNVVRKLAHSFSKTTGVSYDDLFSEGCEAYIRSLRKYKSDIGVAKITYVYRSVTNALITYSKKESRYHSYPEGIEDWYSISFEPLYEISFSPIKYSEDVQLILNMIWERPLRYLPDQDPSKERLNFRKCIGTINKDLRKQGWRYTRVLEAMKDLRVTFIDQFDGN